MRGHPPVMLKRTVLKPGSSLASPSAQGSDPEGDPLRFEFALYADPNLAAAHDIVRALNDREDSPLAGDIKLLGVGKGKVAQAPLAVSVCGLVITRQRPGTASGVIFITLEDETGVCNVVVWPKIYEAFRRVVIGGRLLRITGLVIMGGVEITTRMPGETRREARKREKQEAKALGGGRGAGRVLPPGSGS